MQYNTDERCNKSDVKPIFLKIKKKNVNSVVNHEMFFMKNIVTAAGKAPISY